MSWPRSKAPERDLIPMSIVEPSPPTPMTLVPSFLPRAFKAASTPDATAPPFSKREWIQGTCQADSGKGVVITSRQPVGLITIVSGPAPMSMNFAARASQQPAQPLCPGARYVLGAVLLIATPP
jgi:hypothetical protein